MLAVCCVPHHLAADNGYLLYRGRMVFLANVRTFTQPPLGECNRLRFMAIIMKAILVYALATPDKNFITLVIYMLMQSVKSRIEIEYAYEIHIKITFDNFRLQKINNTRPVATSSIDRNSQKKQRTVKKN